MSTALRPWAAFSKEDMINIAEELGLDVEDKSSYDIAHLIDADLHEHGIPPEEECSQLLDDYLFTCEYIAEDGSVLDWPTIHEIDHPSEDVVRVEESSIIIKDDIVVIDGKEYPKYECFSMADQRDPACRKCKIFIACAEERIRVRPPCFGNYLATDEQCKVCLEALPCSQVKGDENGQTT